MVVKAPPLNIPLSSATVTVSCIDTTSNIIARTAIVVTPQIAGHDYFDTPCFAFLIEHGASGKKLLFDLGIRKDLENFSPMTRGLCAKMEEIRSQKNVADILGEEETSRVATIIWSHHHFDHIGDASTFPPSTNIVVGPGFKSNFIPGYPTNQDAWLLETDYQGRHMIELDFPPGGLKIGQFDAVNYFGDGSLYLLNCPGHTVGHMMALARTTPDSFVLLAADCCHHGGEFRPTDYVPLPDELDLSRLNPVSARSRTAHCPGSLFLQVHPEASHTKPFYTLNTPPDPDMLREARNSQRKLDEFDASDAVFVMMAHDADMKGVIPFWPENVNDWKSKGYKETLRWAFLKDFAVE